jgi:hypothetical protein
VFNLPQPTAFSGEMTLSAGGRREPPVSLTRFLGAVSRWRAQARRAMASPHWSGRRAAFVPIEALDRIDLCFPRASASTWRAPPYPAVHRQRMPLRLKSIYLVWSSPPRGGARRQTTCMRRGTHNLPFRARDWFRARFPASASRVRDDTPQMVNLLLPPDVADGPARILDVFLTA